MSKYKTLSGIILESLRKTTKNVGQDCRSPGRIWNTWPPDYKAELLITGRAIRHGDNDDLCAYGDYSTLCILLLIGTVNHYTVSLLRLGN
jgi:hypothetical protein